MTVAARTTKDWPALPLDAWRDTYDTLHMWTQIVGKVCLALTPLTNHYWNVALQIASHGLTTRPMRSAGCTFTMTFDFVAHVLKIECDDGRAEGVALRPQTVADFYGAVMAALGRLGIDVHIWPMPQEVPDPIPFDQDRVHASYDASAVAAFWRIILAIVPVFQAFRAGFVGKCSPVHFFWGSFDLAVSRFSGRPAPERQGADKITRESYSQEVISHGFWPGSGPVQEPAFYAYAVPEPAGLKQARVRPGAAYYHGELSEFILPYEAVRTAAAPAEDLTAFLQSTYDAAANLGVWNRSELERQVTT